ncbi:OprO/OprP family phosphate-selective porin [Gammaproteobacteria bacterium]|nr:OprO/OprP family phosphate-selective porin [Gammaproteobacteria bacterium]
MQLSVKKIFKKNTLCLAIAGLATVQAATFSVSAQAADKELLDILLANGSLNQEQYDTLLEMEEESVIIEAPGNGGGVSFSSADGQDEIEIGGRLHVDYVQHTNDSDLGVDPVNGTEIRRARIELDGSFAGNWGWTAEYDFADNDVAIKDMKLGYEFENGMSLYAGHQKQPYSLEIEMSSNEMPFMERGVDSSIVTAFTDRAIGLRAQNNGEKWFAAGGIYGDTVNPGGNGDEGWGMSGRYIYTPVLSDTSIVHMGIRGAYRETDDGNSIRLRDETTHFSNTRILNSTIDDTDSITMFGPEFAVVMGAFSATAEYNVLSVDRSIGGDLDFDSWHIEGTWSLTGESRAAAYRMNEGEFKGITPLSDGGAWELAARYESIDLNDGVFVGGSEEVLTAALNWYVNRDVRFMFDWKHILDTDESNLIRSNAPGMDVFSLRAQYNY